MSQVDFQQLRAPHSAHNNGAHIGLFALVLCVIAVSVAEGNAWSLDVRARHKDGSNIAYKARVLLK